MSEWRPRHAAVVEWWHQDCQDVRKSAEHGIPAPTPNKVVVEINSNGNCSWVLEIDNICAKDDRNPIQTKERQGPEELEIVVPTALWMSDRVIVEDDHRFGTNGIWILIFVVCETLVRLIEETNEKRVASGLAR